MLPSPTREKLPKDTLLCFVVKPKSFSQTFLCTIKQNLFVRENKVFCYAYRRITGLKERDLFSQSMVILEMEKL